MFGLQNSRPDAIAKSRGRDFAGNEENDLAVWRRSLDPDTELKEAARSQIVIRCARILLYGIYGIHSHLPPIQSPHQASAHQRLFGMAIRGRSCAGVSNAYSNS